ncbi:MAG: hypothetical protein V7754_18290 [Halioglobus sp.]
MALATLLLGACASEPTSKTESEPQIPASEYAIQAGLKDERGRFREIFCAVLSERGSELPDYRPCEEALTEVGVEAGATGLPVQLGQSATDFVFLIVPGLGWECFAEWLDHEDTGPEHVAQFGYDVRLLPVDGLSSTEHNAEQIRDYITNLPPELKGRPIVLAGYSKGAPDILTAITQYQEVGDRVTAVVSLAGSVGGSPLADDATQSQANLLTWWPGSTCGEGDEGAVESLRTDVRQQWLQDNPLPDTIHYYSVITYPDPERVSWGLKNGYKVLSGVDVRNDTQVLIYDQMIPGSTLVAYANADHWAIAVPVAREHAFIGSTLVNHNDYPREAFLEALLRYVEEDLAENQ